MIMQPSSSSGVTNQSPEEEYKCLNSELWHACAGPLVSLPAVGSRVVYFPQGHSEQVTASTNKEIDTQIPNYPSLQPQLICQLHNVTMHADIETEEVYAQMTLQPLSPQELKDPFLPAELGSLNKQPMNYFCKTLTASDTSTHGGFSVPRRAAEKVFPPLDFSQQPPAQELIAKDLHGNEWKFRHVFRGQPKRHLLTTGWSVFVSAKRLVAGDSVLFIWNDNNQLLLGIRRANRPPTVMPSSVLSSDSMHIGLLAAAAHAAATNSRFTIFYNPRASPSEFVIPLAKYVKAVYHTRVNVGMRFRMLFETEESSVRRYMGTITGISDFDPVRWPNSHWRSLKVGWDESTAGERQPRVSLWEIEPLTTFPMYPSAFPLRLKRPWPTGLPAFHGGKDNELGMNSAQMWLRDGGTGNPGFQHLNFNSGFGINPWMQPRIGSSLFSQTDIYQKIAAATLQNMTTASDPSKQVSPVMLQFQQPQYMPSRSTPVAPDQVSPAQSAQIHPLLPETLQANFPENSIQTQFQQQFLQQQLMMAPPSQPQQQQILAMGELPQHQEAQPSHLQDQSQAPGLLTVYSQPGFLQPQNYTEASSNALPLSSEAASHLLGMPRAMPVTVSHPWSSKRIAVQSVPLLDNNNMQHSVKLAPLPGRECLAGHDEGNNPTDPHHLFNVNMDGSSLLLQSGIPGMAIHNENDPSATVPYSACNFMSSPLSDFPLNQQLTNSECLDESAFPLCSENASEVSRPVQAFVKVSKSGTVGRFLDITRFSSYHELRSELGRLFGLEGQLDDPARSGWQLVFVDREGDILLVGDDPWQEFVSSVSCIKILSPQEVQQMGKQGFELLCSAPTSRLSAPCDNYVSRQEQRNLNPGIATVASLDY